MDSFDWKTYVNNYSDLLNANINTKEKAWKHWLEYGKVEGRSIDTIHNFDWQTYVNNYCDLINAGINTKEKAWNHWLEYGKVEGRTTNCIVGLKYHFVIVTDELISSIAENLKYILNRLEYDAEIIYDKNTYDYINVPLNYIFIITVNLDVPTDLLPKMYIFYQIEQTNNPDFNNNKTLLERSYAIWDFSIKNRQRYNNIDLKKIYYLPMPCTNNINESHASYIRYDILFYGTFNVRCLNILNLLKQKYDIYFSDNLINERDKYISQSKIIINLHYYKDACLETCRINEILKFNKLCISEKAHPDDYYNQNKYENLILYVDEISDDMKNIDNLYEMIDYYLDDSNYNKKIEENKSRIDDLCNKSIFHLHKNLLSINRSNKNTMKYDLNSDKIYCLHLIETPYRMTEFKIQKNYNLIEPLIEIYPAVKANPGWKGCGLSYQNLIWNAKRCNLDTVTICEDDCYIKEDFIEKHTIIKEFLNQYESGWDIFVGIIAELPPDTELLNVIEYKGITFVELNKMHSMVFNIYNKSCFDTIINWDANFNDLDNNIMDQYIKNKKLRIITTYPFEFACIDVNSTLWKLNMYEMYNKMFENSLEIIKNKIVKFISNKKNC